MLHLDTTKGPATVFSAYAPNLTTSPKEKKEFYNKLVTIKVTLMEDCAMMTRHGLRSLSLLGWNVRTKIDKDCSNFIPTIT